MVVKLNTVRLNGASLNHASLNGVGERLRASAGGGGGEVIPPEEPDVPDVPVTYILTASASNGVVSASVNGNAVTLPYTANEGDVVVVEVTANDGYVFEGWSDGSTDNPRSITMTADVTLSATCVVKAVEKEYIQFADPAVEAICVANWSSDGVGLTKEDAAAVTRIDYTVFYQNTAIVSFDEFQYFTGLTSIPSDNIYNDWGLFYQCTALKHLIIPTSVTSIGRAAFAGCTSLTSIGDTSNVKTIAKTAFKGSGLEGTVNYPSLEGKLEEEAFMGTNIERVDNLGKVTTMPYTGYNKLGQFAGCKHLIFARLPSTLTAMGKNTFDSCELLATVICEAVSPPTITNTTFNGCVALTAIYVSDASLEAYKTATNWSQYQSRIKPLSEYTE